MRLTFEDLKSVLPENTIDFAGNGQLTINFARLTGESLFLESSFVESFVKLLEAVASLTDKINAERASQNPPVYPIDFCNKEMVGSPEQPIYQFVLVAGVDSHHFSNNLIDPTA